MKTQTTTTIIIIIIIIIKQQTARVGNRWTHFGARLRPLTSVGAASDHHGADSKSLAAIAFGGQNGNNNNLNNNNNMHQQQRAAVGQPLNSNQVGDQDDNEDLDDDDQDSEALLYKMMQQQGFLTGSIWQQQPQVAGQDGSGNVLSSERGAAGGNANNQLHPDSPSALSNGMLAGNSKKVIKLLKSYSHIHQVDDSDDQIRGTYTRLPAHRLSDQNIAYRGQQPKQHNRANR